MSNAGTEQLDFVERILSLHLRVPVGREALIKAGTKVRTPYEFTTAREDCYRLYVTTVEGAEGCLPS